MYLLAEFYESPRAVGMLKFSRDKNKGMYIPGRGEVKTPVTTACPDCRLE